MDRRLIIILGMILCMQLVSALPPLSQEFYGEAWYFNNNITNGQTITAKYDNNSLICGRFTVQNYGKFGLLSCLGDDNESVPIEGAIANQEITFEINGIQGTAFGNTNFSNGNFTYVQVTVPELVCGDDFCDQVFESCSLCVEDCGVCPNLNETGNTTGNETGGGGDDTSGGGSTGGGSTSSGDTTGSGGAGGVGGATAVTGGATGDAAVSGCRESWDCTEWTECSIENLQTRNCTDQNACGTRQTKPDTLRACEYIDHCVDGIKNYDELGVDCGGSCQPCSHCINGIQDADEQGIDCGGSECNPCASCFDGVRNQGEEGIDCGGPCDAICPEIIQRPGYVCTKSLSPLNSVFLAIIAVLLLSDGLAYLYYNWRKDSIKNNKQLNDFQKAAQKYHHKKIVFGYIISTVLISAMLLLYYWFFGVCEELNTKYFWVLLILLATTYFVIRYLIKVFEFNEQKKYAVLSLINNTHYQHLQEIIQFHRNKLNELGEEINKIIVYLMHDKEFIEELRQNPDLKETYREIVAIYMKKARTDPFTQEEETQELQDIKEKIDSPAIKKGIESHPKLHGLMRRISLMVEQYDEMSQAVQEKTEMEAEAKKDTEDNSEEENTTKDSEEDKQT